jgi:asparagine synthase (glutamine-hydrolysing)
MLNSVGHSAWEWLYGVGRKILPGVVPEVRQPGLKAQKLARILGVKDGMALYSKLVSFWKDVVSNQPYQTPSWLESCRKFSHFEDQMMYGDMVSYLPDDILVKVDRAAMSVSLETRAPFLDHRIVEFAWGLPLKFKVRDGLTKWALRQVLYKYVPRSLIDRPKTGFGVPIDFWLRGALKDWAEDLLSERALKDTGVFCPKTVRKAWMEHKTEQGNWRDHLWIILMYQGWATNRAAINVPQQIVA